MSDIQLVKSRPLPVILLLDVSGSMSENGKIQTLNESVREMLKTFAQEDDSRNEIQVAVITFGNSVTRLYLPLTPAKQISWQDMVAYGDTPMGQAFTYLINLLKDEQQIPKRGHLPTLILVSDGQPTDEWRKPLEELLDFPAALRAARFAMAIGNDADKVMLKHFLDEEARVFEAHEARDILKFFRWVTRSVTVRSRSMMPNRFTLPKPEDLEEPDI